MIVDHALAADAQDVNSVLGLEEFLEVDLLAVLDRFDGRAGGDVAQQRKLGRALLVRQLLIAGDFQRASLVLVAAQDALFFQRPDVLEYRDLAGSELIGQLLHGWGIAMQMAIIPDGDEHIQLAWCEVHGLPRWRRVPPRCWGLQPSNPSRRTDRPRLTAG